MENEDLEIEKAVSYCLAGYEIAYKRTMLRGAGKEEAHKVASEFFRIGLPLLTSKAKANALIACVTAGVQKEVFIKRDARALLYAAQVFKQGCNAESKQSRSRPPH